MTNTELELAQHFVEKTNRNLFLTGKAGTGKTTFLRKLQKSSPKRMVVVAPTGIAAINARGVTIHSFFQLPFGPILPNTTQRNTLNVQRKFSKIKIDIIRSLDLVIIDEISMVRADVLDGIDEVLRRYKDRNKVFGGAQVLMIGDLQQLSPIIKPNEWNLLKVYYKNAYFFSSKAFQKANAIGIELKHIYRQSNEKFINILNEVRTNTLTKTSTKLLNKQYNPNFEISDGDGYITLTTHNRKADTINKNKLSKLTTKPRTYIAKVYKDFNKKNYPNDECLRLKVGAQVMFIKNDSLPEKRYYNGKIGSIIGLAEDEVTVECDSGIINVTVETWENIQYTLNEETQEITESLQGSYTQIPLRLAWAITIHKSQGLTFEKAIIDVESSFAHGQTYVALSRCKTLEGIVLKTPIKNTSIISDTTVNSFNKKIEENQPTKKDLKDSQKQFQLELIEDLFNFYVFLYPVNRLIDLFYTHKKSLKGNIIEPLQSIKNQGIVPLIKIANGFKNQLLKLSISIENLEENELIQERLKKAIDYFVLETKLKITDIFKTFSFSTDNKEVGKNFERQITNFENLLKIKTYLFQNILFPFSIEKFLKTRAAAILTKSEKKKRAEVTSTEHKKLFENLRMFRLSVSNFNNISPFQVFTQKTLFELCELLPKDKKQLKKINGMGKIRIDKYGDEILEIINEYVLENGLTSQIEVLEIEKDTRNTKEITLSLLKEGLTIKEIAKKRGLVTSTIESHVTYLITEKILDIYKVLPKEKVTKGLKIINKNTFESISELKELAGDNFSFNELRMIIAHSRTK